MITFTDVTKSFGDDLVALQNVTFTIEPGELVVITGPSGSGKTTLMRLLTKEYEPTSGEITFNGEPLADIKKSQVHKHRRQIGVVFQDYKLLPELNVWENIALSLYITGQKQNEIEERVTDLLRLISLDDKPFLFPSQLSGGENQRVSIARALATAPAVIFADEPTGNLDAETSASIARLLQKINKLGTTVLVATHDVSVLDLMQEERHMRLEHGTLVKDEKGHTSGSKSKKTKEKVVEAKPEAVVEETPTVSEPGTETEVSQKPPKKGLGRFWPFGKKAAKAETEVESEAQESDVIELPAPAVQLEAKKETSSEPKHEAKTEKQKAEAKAVAASSKKPASQTKIDDKNAKVKVESLWHHFPPP